MIRLIPRPLLITVALALAPTDLAAQSDVCQTILPGETASSVARRLTGRADSRFQPWFRIVDRSRRIIPKVRYNRVHAGWYACVPTDRFRKTPLVVSRRVAGRQAPVAVVQSPVAVPPLAAVAQPPVAVAATRVAAALPIAPRRRIPAAPLPRDPATALALVGLGAAMFGAVIGFCWQSVEQFLEKREAVTREMEGFGSMFVEDFARPLLIAGIATNPICAQLRCVPGDRRLEIRVAPAPGRRYPNLKDHRQNVEYDVERIMQRLSHRAFIRRPLRAEGPWVVIPFDFEPGPKTGAVA